MSHTAPTSHPAVVRRSRRQDLRSLLTIAMIAIVGLAVAVVLLATHNGGGTIAKTAAHANRPAIRANPSDEAGARLDHRGLKTSVPQLEATSSYGGHY